MDELRPLAVRVLSGVLDGLLVAVGLTVWVGLLSVFALVRGQSLDPDVARAIAFYFVAFGCAGLVWSVLKPISHRFIGALLTGAVLGYVVMWWIMPVMGGAPFDARTQSSDALFAVPGGALAAGLTWYLRTNGILRVRFPVWENRWPLSKLRGSRDHPGVSA